MNKAKEIDAVVIAAPHEIPGFDVFIPENGTFESDVLSRYYECALKHEADIIVRITADCPLIDPKIIDFAVIYFMENKFEYVCFAPVDGLDVEVFSFALLENAYRNAEEQYDREHVTPYMRRKTKLSVDTLSDLKKVRRWYGLQK